MTIRQNLVTGLGETFDLNLEFQDAAGNAVDLTGHQVDLHVNKSKTEVGTYNAVVDALGNITLKVADDVTATWPVGKLSYIVKHHSPNGEQKWLMYGALTIVDGVSA